MINRFRMVAGPNGSGKSTLAAWLARDYAVNFYTMLNAFFFDNSGAEMRYLASYSEDAGLDILVPEADLPQWFKNSEIVKKELR